MENKKGINLFFVFIAFVLGLTLYKHFDRHHFSFKDTPLDYLYLVIFGICIFLLVKEYFIKKKE